MNKLSLETSLYKKPFYTITITIYTATTLVLCSNCEYYFEILSLLTIICDHNVGAGLRKYSLCVLPDQRLEPFIKPDITTDEIFISRNNIICLYSQFWRSWYGSSNSFSSFHIEGTICHQYVRLFSIVYILHFFRRITTI